MKCVVVIIGIFKQAIHRIENFVGKKEEPFSTMKKIYIKVRVKMIKQSISVTLLT